MFSPQYDNTTLPDKLRIPGTQRAIASVYYIKKSKSDCKPAWRFDHGGAGVWTAHNACATFQRIESKLYRCERCCYMIQQWAVLNLLGSCAWLSRLQAIANLPAPSSGVPWQRLLLLTVN
jgi:hypothetical protein